MELTSRRLSGFGAEFGEDTLERSDVIQHIKNWMYASRPIAIDIDLGTMHKLPIPDIKKQNYTMPSFSIIRKMSVFYCAKQKTKSANLKSTGGISYERRFS